MCVCVCVCVFLIHRWFLSGQSKIIMLCSSVNSIMYSIQVSLCSFVVIYIKKWAALNPVYITQVLYSAKEHGYTSNGVRE